jgi:cell wall-associated NlpC family hydrolase
LNNKQEKPWLLKNRVWILPIIALSFVFCAMRSESEPQQKMTRWQIVELAKNLVGVPYRFGGIDIDGFDCSGFVFYVYDCFGIKVPRNAREQGRMGGAIKLSNAAPGDILVFKIKGIWHSAIYLGNGRFIHAPNAGGWVRFENLNEYWLSHLNRVINVWLKSR